MHPRTTNKLTQTRDVHRFGFESAGALELETTNTQGASCNRLTYIAFAELVACMSRSITIPLSGLCHADRAIQLHRGNRH
jgi:hypothetical protein